MFKQSTCLCLTIIFAAALIGSACGSKPDLEAEKAAIAKVIDNNILWFKDKDFDLLFSTYAHGPELFMYQLDTASTIRGFDAFFKYSDGWKNPKVGYGGHKIHELDIYLSRGGDTAWFNALLEDCAAFTDRPTRCFTTRLTGVLEKRDGRWVFVQQHFSLPAEKIAEDWAARTAHLPTEGVSVR